MVEVGVYKGTCDDADESAEAARKNSKIIQVKSVGNLVNEYKPDKEKEDGGWDEAQDEPPVFNVGFFFQVTGDGKIG